MLFTKKHLVWVGFILTQTLSGQDYNAVNIPKDLLKNANAVIRELEHTFTVTDTGRALYSGHNVITVLNKNGDNYAEFYDTYDKFDKITDIKGKIYNSEGKVIRKLKFSDFTDQSNISGYSLYEDNRVRYFIPSINNYPYTVEYEYSGIISGIMRYPACMPQYGYDLSVESTVYKITTPSNYNTSFKKINYDLGPKVSESGGNKTYLFEFKNLNAVEYEDLSPGIQDIVPIIHAIPEYFKIDNCTGNNKTWKSLGEWNLKLNRQENKISAKTKSDLADIQAKATDRNDLIKKVYEYMQSKTRYVSIQLGIGGWKPFDASMVDKYGYGDCKALSNYTKTLLNEVGIKSCYTLIYGDRNANDIIYDEVLDQFNHIILCVPDKKDTIWLECTNQLKPFGFLGALTDNRHVLLITDDGGSLVKTPKYTQEKNLLNRKANVNLIADGNADCLVETRYTGLQYDYHFRLLNSPADKQKEQLYKEIDLPSFTIKDFKFDEHKERLPWFDENMNLTVNKCATAMGNRLLLPLNLMNKRTAISSVMKERKTRLKLRYSYIDSDSITYHLPQGFSVEFMPPPVEIKSEFGTYSAKVVKGRDNESVLYIRTVAMNDGYYPPEKYKDYVAFIKEVSKQDNSKISLIKAL